MSFYDEMQDIASELLGEFDQSRGTGTQSDGLWYIHMTPGNGPVDNPGPATPTPYKLDAVSRGVSFRFIGTAGVNGALITASDLQLTAAVFDIEPKPAGFIRADGIDYKIKAIQRVPPTGVCVAHKIVYGK